MKRLSKTVLAFGLLLAPAPALHAGVTPEEAERLRDGTLMPMGGERAGNADGTIPAWEGGLQQPPAGWQGQPHRLVDPFPEDRPLFSITRANLDQYKEKLTPGQIALFERYPATFRMPIYPARRTTHYRQYTYDATYRNALAAEMIGIDVVRNAVTGVPFPIPKTAAEIIWNHKLRDIGVTLRRWNAMAAVGTDGNFALTVGTEDIDSPYLLEGMTWERLANRGVFFLQTVKKPLRDAGTLYLAHSPLDQVKDTQKVWMFNSGQRRLRRAPALAYDYPQPGIDGLGTVDQIDIFNGPLDRYEWKLHGKREIYVPYNAYRIHSDKLKYRDIIRAGHINPDHARYELHRVWVVEATLRKGTTHVYARRVFYVDEDSWQMVLADNYDGRGMLWRVQEAHSLCFYDPKQPRIMPILEANYDLLARRYVLQMMNNEEEETKDMVFPKDYFEPSNLQNLARHG